MKTASDLQIRQEELDALVWVRDELAAGRIEHQQDSLQGLRFNMAVDFDPSDCGTVCCIAGWSALHIAGLLDSGRTREMQTAVNCYMYGEREGSGHSPRLYELFFPTVAGRRQWSDIPVDQVVRTITNFLETGAINWIVKQEQML